MIKTYNEFHELNEGNLKNSFLVSLIAMSLLNSCQVSRHNKHKEATPVETPNANLTDYNDHSISDEIKRKYGISSGNIEPKNIKPHPTGNVVSADFDKNRGCLPWPTEKGEVTQKYGIGAARGQKKVQMKNDGLYICVPINSKIRPVFNGQISKVFDVCGETCIIITHGKYYSVYSGFSTLGKDMKIGKKVTTETVLGLSKTEISFQIWMKTGDKVIPVDPTKFLKH